MDGNILHFSPKEWNHYVISSGNCEGIVTFIDHSQERQHDYTWANGVRRRTHNNETPAHIYPTSGCSSCSCKHRSMNQLLACQQLHMINSVALAGICQKSQETYFDARLRQQSTDCGIWMLKYLVNFPFCILFGFRLVNFARWFALNVPQRWKGRIWMRRRQPSSVS